MRALLVLALVSSGCLDLDELGHLHDLGEDASVADLAPPDLAAPLLRWTRQSTGLPAGDVKSIAYRNGIGYAATASGGMWRWTDAGATWTFASSGFVDHSMNQVAVDEAGVAWVATGNSGIVRGNSDGTWTALATLPITDVMSVLVVGSGATATVYAGGATDIYVSDDEGLTWSTAASPDMGGAVPHDVHTFVEDQDHTVYAGATNGVFAFIGGAWTQTWTGDATHPTNVVAMTVASSPGRLFAGNGIATGGLLSTALPATSASVWTPVVLTPPAQGIQALTSDASGTVYAASQNVGIYALGTSPQLATGPLLVTEVESLALFGSAVVSAGSSGLGRSTDGGATWSASNVGLSNTHIVAMAEDPSGTYVGMPASGQLFRTTNIGQTWVSANGGFASVGAIQAIAIDPKTTSRLYAGTSLAGVWATTTHGSTWTQAAGGAPTDSVSALAIDPAATNTLYAAGIAGVFKSTDGGGSWALLSGTPGSASALLVTADALYAAGPGGSDGGTGPSLVRSTDGGATFSAIDVGLPSFPITSLISAGAVDTLYAATAGGGVYTTTNGGTTWSPANTGLGTTMVRAVVARSDASDVLYVATSSGVYQTTDGALTWHAVSSGLDNLDVRTVVVTSTGAVLAGTDGDGVYLGQ